MIEVGDRISFVPAPNTGCLSTELQLRRKVTGTVVQVHEEHRWYRVEYILGKRPDCIGHECFKF